MKKKTSLTIIAIFASSLFVGTPTGTATLSTGYSAQKSSFAVKFRDEISNYRVNGIFVMPGEEVVLGVANGIGDHIYQMSASGGAWQAAGPRQWKWRAPRQHGLNKVTMIDCNSQESILLNIFVMIPASKVKNGQLNGYKIGSYPAKARSRSEAYVPPQGYIEVTPENRNTLVSPHFKLGQFLCKQEGSYPKYVVLRERLLFKLETLLEEVNSYGFRCDSLTVMSGFRTPHYNKILNNVAYSRHMWGDAADIFVDYQPTDDMMDDLNKDGKIDFRDSKVLGRLVENLDNRPGHERFEGGVGLYTSNRAHGPFVHVDARGKKARW